MRVLLSPFGSRGDVQPMLALGLALAARGHRVVVCGPPDCADWAAGLGLSFHSIGGSFREFHVRSTQGFSGIRYAMRELPLRIAEHYRALEPFAADCDVMLGSTLTAAGASLAEKLGFVYRYVTFTPAAIPSAEHPSLFTRSQSLPRWLNRLSWWQSAWANNFGLRSVINAERRRLGLKPISDAWLHLMDHGLLVASDPALAPLPTDSPMAAVQTGAWVLPDAAEPLPPELEAYLAAGPPPVFVGMGSMPSPKSGVLESLRGQRVLVSGGLPASEGMFAVGDVPHSRLFPRCALVIHHGGAGTTHTAARAGVPQRIVPHATDQFFWRKRVESLGLGDAEQARAFAPQLLLDGVDRAVRLLEDGVQARRKEQ